MMGILEVVRMEGHVAVGMACGGVVASVVCLLRGRGWGAVLLVMLTLEGPGDIDVISAPATDLEILLGGESIEMLEELEFYSWLDTEELEGDGDLG